MTLAWDAQILPKVRTASSDFKNKILKPNLRVKVKFYTDVRYMNYNNGSLKI